MRMLRVVQRTPLALVCVLSGLSAGGLATFGPAACSRAIAGPGISAARAEEPDELDRRIATLIEHLGDKDYAVRQRSQQELSRLGFMAFDALTDAEQSDDIEIATQSRYLVRLIRADWTNDNAPPQVKQLLRDYDFQNEATRLAKMKSLLDLPADAGLDWLCRLVRFEQSPVLSKQAALLIIGQEPQPDEANWPKRTATIAKVLDRSTRPAARWLKTYVQMHSDPQAALRTWAEMVAGEQKTLDEHPQQSDVRVVIGLLRIQVDQLQALGRDAEAQQAMRDMVALERGEPQNLVELVGWLVKRKAWAAIDDVATRFAPSFEADGQLLYTLAQASSRRARPKRPNRRPAGPWRSTPTTSPTISRWPGSCKPAGSTSGRTASSATCSRSRGSAPSRRSWPAGCWPRTCTTASWTKRPATCSRGPSSYWPGIRI